MKKLSISLGVLVAALTSAVYAEPITVLTSDNRLITVDSTAPNTTTEDTVTVTGLASGETLLGIDYRPATGTLYGLGSTGVIYAVNADTGVATLSSTLTADSTDTTAPYTGLSGTSFGVDFNPVPDRLRVVSNTGQSLRINVATGATTTDGNLDYPDADTNGAATPSVVAAAYTNSFAGALATTLYDIDSNLDILAIQNPPNDGTLRTVGPLSVNTSDAVGFDISGKTGAAYAALTISNVPQLYTINLLSGAAAPTSTTAPTSAVIAPTELLTGTVVDIAALVNPGSRVDNISTRGRVGSSDQDFLIAGLITRGGASSRILVRGIGPSLTAQNVTGALADPVLEIFDSNGASIATNDNWKSTQQAEIEATGLAPTNDAEAAILRNLAPGTYTAVVSGKDSGSGRGTGTGLVEVYQLEQ